MPFNTVVLISVFVVPLTVQRHIGGHKTETRTTEKIQAYSLEEFMQDGPIDREQGHIGRLKRAMCSLDDETCMSS